MSGWLIAGGIVLLFIAFVGWACIHVGAQSERRFNERNGEFRGSQNEV